MAIDANRPLGDRSQAARLKISLLSAQNAQIYKLKTTLTDFWQGENLRLSELILQKVVCESFPRKNKARLG
jgi:hypothetical protein